MLEKEIRARDLAVWALWFASVATWAVSWIVDIDDLGRLALIICGAAITAQIKGMFIDHAEHLKAVASVTATVASPIRTRQ